MIRRLLFNAGLIGTVSLACAQSGPAADAVAAETTSSRPGVQFGRSTSPSKLPSLDFGVDAEAEASTGPIELSAGQYAVFHTSEGDILIRLLPDQAPKTVENFIGLASGKKSWKHPVTLADMQKPLYNNTSIFKTVENALLYGGDPIDRGIGDPGYSLPLEPPGKVRFNTPGLLATGLSGANASGSRWIMTLRSFPHWDGRYTVFGQVIGGMDVARAISRKPNKRDTVPLDPVMVSSIEIVEIPAGKTTTALYSAEQGTRFVTIEKEFKDAPQPVAPPPVDKPTSPTQQADKPTTASADQPAGIKESK